MLPSADENEKALSDERGSGHGYLYRYRDLVSERADWVREIVQESKIYLASPAAFNDPFDCKARFSGDMSPEEFRTKATALLRGRGMPRGERRRTLRSAPSPERIAASVAAGMQEEVDRTGVLSLSATHENILMWSHYASGHRGVCLQFHITPEAGFLAEALPVIYSTELLIPTLFGKDPAERVQALILTKSTDWAYEREWRVVTPDIPPGPRAFPESALTAVILGCNISEKDREKLSQWSTLRKKSLKIYQAERHPQRYGLQFRLVT